MGLPQNHWFQNGLIQDDLEYPYGFRNLHMLFPATNHEIATRHAALLQTQQESHRLLQALPEADIQESQQ